MKILIEIDSIVTKRLILKRTDGQELRYKLSEKKSQPHRLIIISETFLKLNSKYRVPLRSSVSR